jgi:hypothetical protein|tara:strand:+ start:2164 stop:5604 length:3441 start_codon:yes stop_codon:yes gene_type:complete
MKKKSLILILFSLFFLFVFLLLAVSVSAVNLDDETKAEDYRTIGKGLDDKPLIFGNTEGKVRDFVINNIEKRANKGDRSDKEGGLIEVYSVFDGFLSSEITYKIENFNPEKFGVAGLKVPLKDQLKPKEFKVEFGLEQTVSFQVPKHREQLDTIYYVRDGNVTSCELPFGDFNSTHCSFTKKIYIENGTTTKFKQEIIYGKTEQQVKNKTAFVRISGKWNPSTEQKFLDVLVKYGSWRKEFAWWSTSAGFRIPINITAQQNVDTNGTFFVLGIDTTSADWTGVNNNRAVLIKQDTNTVLDFIPEGDFNVSTDLNLSIRYPINLNTGDDYNGTDSNGLMMYVNDVNFSNAFILTMRDYNEVFWDGDNFDTNTLDNYDISSNANWTDVDSIDGYISSTSGTAEGFVGRNVGTIPSDVVLMMRQKSNRVTGLGSCLNALGSPSSNRGHCMSGIAVGDNFSMEQPNVSDDTDLSPAVALTVDNFFGTIIFEFTDTNFSGFARDVNGFGIGSSQNWRPSSYQRFFNDSTKEAGFTDLSNTRVNFGFDSAGVGQADIDWWAYFKYLNPAITSLGSREALPVFNATVEKIDDYDFNAGLPQFSFAQDGNVRFTIRIESPDFNTVILDLNLSHTQDANTGSVIIQDLNLLANPVYCDTQDFTVATNCFWDLNLFGILDGNYFVNAEITDGVTINTSSSNNSFLIDNTPPTIIDLNIFGSQGGFNESDVNVGILIECGDNNSSILRNTISYLDVNRLDGNFPVNTLASTDVNLDNGVIVLNGFCFDQAGNSATDSNTFNFHAILFIIIDEITGADFNVDSVLSLRALEYDTNTDFNFMAAGTNQVYFVSTQDDVIRFEFGYTGLIIPRDINLATITDTNQMFICGVEEKDASFQTQTILSSSRKQAIVVSDLYNCYVLSDYTKFASNDILSNFAYTISQVYTLTSDGILISLIDGITRHNINLDLLEFNREPITFNITQDQLAMDFNLDSNILRVQYFNQTDDANSVVITVFDGTTSTVLFTTTNTTTPNDFNVTFFQPSFADLNRDIYLVQATITRNNGVVDTISLYSTLKGTDSNILNPVVASVVAIAIIILMITLVSTNSGLGWFGIIAGLFALIITTLSPVIWYLQFIQAIVIMVTIFVSLTFWKENSGVT